MDQFLLALCGIPASGKSALASFIATRLMRETDVIVVSTDDWRNEEYYADFRPDNEKRVRKAALEETESVIGEGKSVIHDDTNYYASMRHELYEIAMRNGCSFATLHVSTPVDEALSRNRERDTPIPEQVVRRISEKLDVPGSKYAWDSPIATVNLGARTLDDAADEIVDRLKTLEPRSEIGEIRNSDAQSRLLDVITRQVVARFLQENPTYRNDPRITKKRREVLKKSKAEGLAPYETEQTLTAMLRVLMEEDS
ncbi:MAG: AAA family ATPase [Candidatus Thorarchaeota archaeon]|nr:MAG: AAA family ATPase [Candidatus Thorarchaeota archaeon]